MRAQDGILNAVVMWFDLYLDDQATVTSAPAGIGIGGVECDVKPAQSAVRSKKRKRHTYTQRKREREREKMKCNDVSAVITVIMLPCSTTTLAAPRPPRGPSQRSTATMGRRARQSAATRPMTRTATIGTAGGRRSTTWKEPFRWTRARAPSSSSRKERAKR